MKNAKELIKNGNWHEDIVTKTLDTVTLGRFSDQPQDTHAREKAARQLEDTQRKVRQEAEDKKREVQIKYQKKQKKSKEKKKIVDSKTK